ncbi:hypothetical protein LTR84_012457 [Exophiala bonariae]|uniref:Uncharacterized protein n=1 Tax=Exophiala bonariae TaxID=1690606 RepID=A0AAV9NEF3_9EURO|nr:hypothetical protein LTR84_012457 [Exophiala bonariae]
MKPDHTQSQMQPIDVDDVESAETHQEPVLVSSERQEESESGKPSKNSKDSSWKVYLRVWGYATSIDHAIRICGIIAALANGAALPLMTLVFGDMVDKFNAWGTGEVTPDDLMKAISRNSLWFTYLFIAILALSFLMNSCFRLTAIRSTKALRRDFVQSLIRQDVTYFDSCLPGTVATLISNNADLIENGLGERVGLAFEGVGQLLVSFIVAFARQWKLTFVVATMLPLTILIIGVAITLMTKVDVKVLDVYSKAGGIAEEGLSTMPIITAFGASNKLQVKYDDILQVAKNLGAKKGPIMGVQMSAQWSVTFVAYAIAWFYGVQLVARGEVSTGGRVITVLTSVLIGIISLTLIVPAIGEVAKASAAAQGLFEVIDRKSEIDPLDPRGEKPTTVLGQLRLDNVSFAYPSRPSVKVIDNLTLDFEAGKTTAVVGPSGSGKSTIVALISRWFDPSQGSVLLDGKNIKDLNIQWLRSQAGFVQQESVLFNDTILHNISHGLFGTPADDASDQEKFNLVKDACKQAFANDFVEELPEKFNTFVGDRGNLLSGGQKQRIAIARSIIRDPHILLLDEATSALDPTAEAIVQEAINNVAKARTTIMITHKVSTVQKADKIIVLSKGRLMEQGTHQQLLAKKGVYYELVAAQTLEKQQEVEDALDLPEVVETSSLSSYSFKETKKEVTEVSGTRIQAVDSTAKVKRWRSFTLLMKQQRHLWPLFLGGLIGSIGSGSVFPVQATIFSRAILIFQFDLPDEKHRLESRGNFWGLMFLALALGVLVFYAALGTFFTTLAFQVSSFYRSKYFCAMIGQDIGYFEQNSPSASISRLSTDPQRVQDLISPNLGFILLSLVNVFASCTLALAVGWKIAVVAIFGCLPPLFFAGFVRMRIDLTSQERLTKIYLESARFAAEAVASIRTVSSLTLEMKVVAKYNELLDTRSTQSLVQTTISNTLFAVTESLYLAILALVFWWGGKLLSQREYDVQQFFMVFIAVIFGGQAAGFMFGSTLQTTKALNATRDIMSLLQSRPPINTAKSVVHHTGTSTEEQSPPIANSNIAVEFRDVNFSYPSRPSFPVLQNLNLTIHKGESIGIAGASGSGKSTLIALIERFYDAGSGSILINDISIKDLDVHSHRARTGLVSQETTLYQGTIQENILLGIPTSQLPTISEEHIVQACRDANIHDFIQSLPEGYATQVGTRGVSLSGGQRQRLAIARALIRNPTLLLLDEATSALDSENERLVQQAIEAIAFRHSRDGDVPDDDGSGEVGRRATGKRTTIAVAHRLSTIQRCDRIFVLARGTVVEHGTHAELYARRGRYYRMVLAQSLDREVEV